MKSKLPLLLTCMFFITCSIQTPNFDWIIGTWKRTNGKADTQTLEAWKKIDDSTYASEAVVLKGKDTVFIEYCTIAKEGNKYFYIADVPQNPDPIKFEIIELSKLGFKASNPSHDFPKTVQYQVSESGLTASISGGEKQIDYHFVKQ